MRFSQREIRDLFTAWVMISLAFAILFSGGYSIFSDLNVLMISFVIAFFTAGIGFLFHELMHKYTAQRYGLWAEFKASYGYLWLAILLSFFGFIFAAPGGVYISGMITRERNGKISLAGPLTNIVLAGLFLIPLSLIANSALLQLFVYYGFRINAILAVFNLLPIAPFDGFKVYEWNKSVYIAIALVSLALFIGGFLI